MMRSKETVRAFDIIFEKHLEGTRYGLRRTAYELAENEWIATYGERRYKDYRNFRISYNDRKNRPYKTRNRSPRATSRTRFMEIFNYWYDPYQTIKANYEAAEAKYSQEFGATCYKSYDSFLSTRSTAQKRAKAKLLDLG
jgi:hypothetical protein